MVETARKNIQQALLMGEIKGPNITCKYYPCHFERLDCTWCFCPFYPCDASLTGGKYAESNQSEGLVWDCSNCNWIHQSNIAETVLKEILLDGAEFETVPKEKLLKLRQGLIKMLGDNGVDE